MAKLVTAAAFHDQSVAVHKPSVLAGSIGSRIPVTSHSRQRAPTPCGAIKYAF